MRDARVDALAVGREDRVGRLQVAALDRVVELGLVGVEAGDVLRGQELLAADRATPSSACTCRPTARRRARAGGRRSGCRTAARTPAWPRCPGRRSARSAAARCAGAGSVASAREQRQRRGQQEGKQGGLDFHRGGFAARVGLIFAGARNVRGRAEKCRTTTQPDQLVPTEHGPGFDNPTVPKVAGAVTTRVTYVHTHKTGPCGRAQGSMHECGQRGSAFAGPGR